MQNLNFYNIVFLFILTPPILKFWSQCRLNLALLCILLKVILQIGHEKSNSTEILLASNSSISTISKNHNYSELTQDTVEKNSSFRKDIFLSSMRTNNVYFGWFCLGKEIKYLLIIFFHIFYLQRQGLFKTCRDQVSTNIKNSKIYNVFSNMFQHLCIKIIVRFKNLFLCYIYISKNSANLLVYKSVLEFLISKEKEPFFAVISILVSVLTPSPQMRNSKSLNKTKS